MKIRSSPLDDIYQELQFVLTADGGPFAQLILRLFTALYRWHHSAILFALRRRRWRPPVSVECPPLRCDPFNPRPQDPERPNTAVATDAFDADASRLYLSDIESLAREARTTRDPRIVRDTLVILSRQETAVRELLREVL
jgi:hypothetical protein